MLCSDKEFNILIIGDASVGKTSLLWRYMNNEYSENYQSTLSNDYVGLQGRYCLTAILAYPHPYSSPSALTWTASASGSHAGTLLV